MSPVGQEIIEPLGVNASDAPSGQAGSSLPASARHAPTVFIKSDPVGSQALDVDHSVLLDRAYDEYCHLCEAGAKPDPDEFCGRYPAFQSSLRSLLAAHRLLEEHPELLESGTPTWPEAGDVFLGFYLIRELGRGAFARVFLASEPALGNRHVAVKIALRGGTEAEILGRLRHPNIVPVHSVQQDPQTGLTAVCMPYGGAATLTHVLDHIAATGAAPVTARSLADVVRPTLIGAEGSAPFPELWLNGGSYVEAVTEIGIQTAEALAFVHARGVFHRDLKPSNILLSSDGRPLLLDFNLSFDQQSGPQRLGGTLPYMAPEQLEACSPTGSVHPLGVGPKADLFSLGVILFELLTGEHPFGPISLKTKTPDLRELLLSRQINQGPRPLRKLNRRVCPALAEAIAQCLAVDPALRPHNATQLAQTLRQSLRARSSFSGWARSHALALALWGGIALTGAMAAPFFLPHSQSSKQLDQGKEALAQHEWNKAQEFFDQALKSDPESFDAWFGSGFAQMKLGEKKSLEAALNDFDKARQFKPYDRDLLASMSWCYFKKGDNDKALACLSAIPLAGLQPRDMNNLACFLIQKKGKDNLRKAQDLLRRTVVAEPGFIIASNNFQISDYLLAKEENRLTMPPKPAKAILEFVDPFADVPE